MAGGESVNATDQELDKVRRLLSLVAKSDASILPLHKDKDGKGQGWNRILMNGYLPVLRTYLDKAWHCGRDPKEAMISL